MSKPTHCSTIVVGSHSGQEKLSFLHGPYTFSSPVNAIKTGWMASDLKQGRRRANSNAVLAMRGGQGRTQPKPVAQSKSSHTSDEFLQDFLNPSFDPAAYLNATLPPLSQRSGQTQAGTEAVSLAELSSKAQTSLSQLNAHTTRLSSVLTQLTDDILRSGSRLAYEVELLRGETLSLSETMNETLKEDISMFVPEGLQQDADGKKEFTAERGAKDAPTQKMEDPAYIKQLQTLTLVRSRLELVIKTFGDAMEFVFPPSEVSVSSSFLSVSAPEPGSQQQSSEDKGQQVLQQLRDEISDALRNTKDPVQGIEKAAQRIEELKELTNVWKDTAEERGRTKFVESLAKMVEDRHKELMKEMEAVRNEGRVEAGRSRKGSVTRDAAMAGGAAEDPKMMPGGFGLIGQLQRLRNGL
ncbi:hypothetical protein S7711_06164 [Stachybotrys chartarum IBT 7711]|uniref:Uncharacterized protein n=1 Tax=Stachybotrys chartarum (strain CBS 109288 / IBT 7711) TaxID=1280523 RepID=A0A084AM92_STACB|nr:hypothetical protein S7711_06164 [Stachybotrys chartarum IBT 7711]KFA54868.1 hypothetical protein S40293_09106 [Stachybotrys chartarum IBT 40293]